ncbi:hypothetical protein [Deinococcus sp. S9]|uniref:hypothetical protein n=1 Tax=Deinococcus sp. S9 TaxID=2545754 RepID=UPI001056C647|nr:hypothetical protein [Deinococcus sp. S9]TDE84731.1 hypothetical protein E0686_15565 [Deinococcus sp. S9]
MHDLPSLRTFARTSGPCRVVSVRELLDSTLPTLGRVFVVRTHDPAQVLDAPVLVQDLPLHLLEARPLPAGLHAVLVVAGEVFVGT